MYLCESQKYDMEFEVRKRDFEVVLNLPREKRPLYVKTNKKNCSPPLLFLKKKNKPKNLQKESLGAAIGRF